MALRSAGITVELREVVLKNKPASMLAASEKGTVPVLLTEEGNILDESLDIMLWALESNELDQWLDNSTYDQCLELIEENDYQFKYWLDRYKYHVGYPERTREEYLEECMVFIDKLEKTLSEQRYLVGKDIRLADIAIFPFVRQFAFSDKKLFDGLSVPNLQNWLDSFLTCELFVSCMKKYEPWQEGTTGAKF